MSSRVMMTRVRIWAVVWRLTSMWKLVANLKKMTECGASPADSITVKEN